MFAEIKPQAYLALLLWIPLVLVLFATTKPTRAALISMIAGALFLPERAAFDPPGLPPFDKHGISALAAVLGLAIFGRKQLRQAKLFGGVGLWFVLVLVGNIGTSMTNPDAIAIGGGLDYDGVTRLPTYYLPPVTKYDAIASSIRDLIGILLPFWLGRTLVRDRQDIETFMRVLAGCMLIYVPLILIEIRLSPQLHFWIYGYRAIDFSHLMRGGGFKPTVFTAGGLAVGMLLVMAVFAAAGLRRLRRPVSGIPAGGLLVIFWGVLALSRNVGANIYAAVCVPLLMLGRRTGSAGRLAVMLALLVISFPALRMTEVFPTDRLVETAAKYSPARAQSLEFRFDNEDILLERARERLWFGWGGYGRNRIFDERGKDISVTDGEWILRVGIRGLLGFAGSFGLLLWPVLVARRRGRLAPDPEDARLLDNLALLAAVSAVDLLPNSIMNTLPFLISGAVAGVSESMVRNAREARAAALARYA